jgi:hypothetical protein
MAEEWIEGWRRVQVEAGTTNDPKRPNTAGLSERHSGIRLVWEYIQLLAPRSTPEQARQATPRGTLSLDNMRGIVGIVQRRADLHRWCVRGLSTRPLSEESQIIGGCGIRLTDERYRCIARTKERACVARNTPTWREVALHAALPRMLAFEFPNGYDTCSRMGIIVCVDHVAARMHRDG